MSATTGLQGSARRDYEQYVEELASEVPDVQPCSFDHWLRGEIADGVRDDQGNVQ